MDGFTYTNIFDTKGIEYLIVIAFFAILIPFWISLNRGARRVKQAQKSGSVITSKSLSIPQGLFFSKYHSWAFLEKTGFAKIGLDDLLLHLTGEVTLDNLREPGEEIKKGELMATIDHNGKKLHINSPVSGKIQRTNERLPDEPGLLREAPYQQGWIYSIKPSNWKTETNSHFLAEDATQWAMQELDKFKDFVAVSITKHLPEPSKIILQDGGELIDHPLSELPEEVWTDFQQTFLS